MTKPYLESRNGTIYEINSITRKQMMEVQKLVISLKDIDKLNQVEQLEDITKLVFKFNYPSLTDEEFEDILDYNAEVYGFNELYEMLGYILEDVFTQQSGAAKKINPYLEEKRAKKTQIEA